MGRPSRITLDAWNSFENLEIYILTELEKRSSKKYKYTWEDRLVGLMDDCELAIAEANAADAKGTPRRLATGRGERFFYLICLKIRKGYRLGIFSDDQYKVISVMIHDFEVKFIPWSLRFNTSPAFIRTHINSNGKEEPNSTTFSRIL